RELLEARCGFDSEALDAGQLSRINAVFLGRVRQHTDQLRLGQAAQLADGTGTQPTRTGHRYFERLSHVCNRPSVISAMTSVISASSDQSAPVRGWQPAPAWRTSPRRGR